MGLSLHARVKGIDEAHSMDKKSALPLVMVALAALPWLISDTTDASTYRWVDQNGNPVLSDRPPEAGIPYTEVGIETGFRRYAKPVSAEKTESSDNPAPGGKPATLAASTDVSESVRIEAVEPQPALCDQARDNIFKLETFARMRVQDDSGEVRFMTDDERASQLNTAYQVRDANCDSD